MKLMMAGLDHTTAPVELREQLSFDAQAVRALDRVLREQPGVAGAVLLSTCNRTELYLSAEGSLPHPGKLLCEAAFRDWGDFRTHFVCRTGEDARRHLMEVACGLHSRIWGEEQILSQVRQAMERAQAVQSADARLNALFLRAITAGKEVQTSVTFTAVSASAASRGVELLEQRLGGLHGRRAVVIGNGEMGRLTARLLHTAGAEVIVTLRRYRHRETVVPCGCTAVPYEDRLALIDGADVLCSATTSPHYTFTCAQARSLRRCPPLLLDLAVPRDMEPGVEQYGSTLFNVDDLGFAPAQGDVTALSQAKAIVEKHLRSYRAWERMRESRAALTEVQAALGRRFAATELTDPQEAAERAVELVLAGLRGSFDAPALLECARRIDAHTRKNKNNLLPMPPQYQPFRFPLFTDLRGKRVVVVGGGQVARRRIGVLKPFGPDIVVIAPALDADATGITWLRRSYRPGDLRGAVLAIAASDSRRVNRQVGREARARNIPVSVADAPEECTFFFPAVCRGKTVLAGVCSKGEHHAAVARAGKEIRILLEEKKL